MTVIRVTGAILRFLPALVWAILAYDVWTFVRTRRPRNPLFRLLGLLATFIGTTFFLSTLYWLIPPDVLTTRPLPVVGLLIVSDLCVVAGTALFWHMVQYLPLGERPAGAGRLTLHYGTAGAVGLLALFFPVLIPLPTFDQQLLAYRIVFITYQVVVLALGVRSIHRFARRGGWRPGGSLVLRRVDVVAIAGGAMALAGELVLAASRQPVSPLWWLLLDVTIGFAFSLPVAVRILGDVVRGLLLTAALAGAMGAVYFGGRLVAPRVAGEEAAPFVELALILGLSLALVLGLPALRDGIDRLVFGRRRRWQQLQHLLHGLSPELGAVRCCERALAGLVGIVRELRGAAIILGDGTVAVHGDLRIEPLARVWPRGAAADALPPRPLDGYELVDLPFPLLDAVTEAQIVAVAPIRSPGRRWGHLFITTGLLGASFLGQGGEALEAFVDQLALVLDAAELLARTVAVERALAHSEKLAAIGELAARIAHEIRNPVTAARSLAQQLAREPGAPFREEHGLILGELERVERQVSALLRFARRDELRLEPVDLGELVRATVATFRPRLDAAGIGVELDLVRGVEARADREKLRQVLINLIENAMDALGETAGPRRLTIAVGNGRGVATLRVADSGPGVPADALSRVFEPFFSLKAKGTGLGLAIARRTIEAHGGRIGAVSAAGLTVDIELPRAGGG